MGEWVQILRLTSLGVGLMVAACTPGPRLEASWYLVYEPAAREPYVWVDPDPPVPAPAPPVNAPKPVGTIYVSIRNLGDTVKLDEVLLTTDGKPLQRPERPGEAYILRRGEVLVLPMVASADSTRECLVPTMLTVTAAYPRRSTRTLKVTGASPTSLPEEWIEQCNGARSAEPSRGWKGRP